MERELLAEQARKEHAAAVAELAAELLKDVQLQNLDGDIGEDIAAAAVAAGGGDGGNGGGLQLMLEPVQEFDAADDTGSSAIALKLDTTGDVTSVEEVVVGLGEELGGEEQQAEPPQQVGGLTTAEDVPEVAARLSRPSSASRATTASPPAAGAAAKLGSQPWRRAWGPVVDPVAAAGAPSSLVTRQQPLAMFAKARTPTAQPQAAQGGDSRRTTVGDVRLGLGGSGDGAVGVPRAQVRRGFAAVRRRFTDGGVLEAVVDQPLLGLKVQQQGQRGDGERPNRGTWFGQNSNCRSRSNALRPGSSSGRRGAGISTGQVSRQSGFDRWEERENDVEAAGVLSDLQEEQQEQCRAQSAARRQWSHQKQQEPLPDYLDKPRRRQQQPQWEDSKEQQPQQQQQQQSVWAPLPTLLDVLLIQPLQVQYKITTLVCWQQILHRHQLLATCEQLHLFFFQKAGDWAQLLAEKLEEQLQV